MDSFKYFLIKDFCVVFLCNYTGLPSSYIQMFEKGFTVKKALEVSPSIFGCINSEHTTLYLELKRKFGNLDEFRYT